jgi:hypothetical protein
MRSTLSGVHTVRSGSNTHSSSTRSSGRDGSSRSAPRPPAPPGPGTSGTSGRNGSGGASLEHAHSAADAHPGSTAAATVFAAGANAGASAARTAAFSEATHVSPQAAAPSTSSSGGQGPHVVSSRGGSTQDARSGASDTASSSGRAETRTLAPPAAGSGTDPDGFARVQTRQRFTLETT